MDAVVSYPEFVYVCQEENEPTIASQTGFSTQFLCVKDSAKNAFKWVKDRVAAGKRDGFTPEDERFENRDHVIGSIQKAFDKTGYFHLLMISCEGSYTITVSRKEIEKC